jgi:hypothetical protein
MRRLLPHDYAGRAPIERRCAALWRCGPRTVAAFLDELSAEHDIANAIDAKLREYGRLNPNVVAAVGGDGFAAAPTRVVGSEP